jgi:hypothetical protein
VLDDGTLAGHVDDGGLSSLIGRISLSIVDAATLCATTPARELGLVGHGVLAPERRRPGCAGRDVRRGPDLHRRTAGVFAKSEV